MYTFILGAGKGLGKSLYKEILIRNPKEKFILSSSSLPIETKTNIIKYKCDLSKEPDVKKLLTFISNKHINLGFWNIRKQTFFRTFKRRN